MGLQYLQQKIRKKLAEVEEARLIMIVESKEEEEEEEQEDKGRKRRPSSAALCVQMKCALACNILIVDAPAPLFSGGFVSHASLSFGPLSALPSDSSRQLFNQSL